jgi:ubiquinone/menaquinone biosynthesis C-methylase UbiE
MRILHRIAAPQHPNSLGNRMRRRRFELFRGLLDRIGKPARILDVGGREGFWRQMGFADEPGVEIVLVNLEQQRTERPNFRCTSGDARSMPQFEDDEFDVAFSNSVIEHVGGWQDQVDMAN